MPGTAGGRCGNVGTMLQDEFPKMSAYAIPALFVWSPAVRADSDRALTDDGLSVYIYILQD